MAYGMPMTRNAFNMYDCCSYMQKACRRGLEEDAGFAACELFATFNTVMWNRMVVVSCEDCCGAFTKELIKLRYEDEIANKDKKGYFKDTSYVSKAIHLLSKSTKSRDACYFACNFILAYKYNRDVIDWNIYERSVTDDVISDLKNKTDQIEDSVFTIEYLLNEDVCAKPEQKDLFSFIPEDGEIPRHYKAAAILKEAIKNNDMEVIGYMVAELRRSFRSLIWKTLYSISNDNGSLLSKEIIALCLADDRNNKKRMFEKKDEIFISKAIMLLCYQQQGMKEHLKSQDIVTPERFTNWEGVKYLNILDCKLKDGVMPEWVFDVHTIKGKSMGKTDWDMNIVEQAGLNPLKKAFFDEGTWQSLYEWLKAGNGHCTDKEYADHLAYRNGRYNNPVSRKR